jgi:predicted GNAT family acetyltransferase
MEILNPKEAKKFLLKTRIVLETDELFGNLMYGIVNKISNNKNQYGDEDPFFTIISEDNETNIFGLMTPPYTMLVYSNKYTEKAIDLFVNNIIEHCKNIPGITGEKYLVEIIINKYIKKTKREYILDKKLGIYKLEKVNEYQKPDGTFRKAEIKDREIIKEYSVNFSNYTNEPITDNEKLDKNVTEDIMNNNYYVYEYNNEIASMARKQRPTKNGMAIGPVYTFDKYRNRGYGTAVVSELSKIILNSGKTFCTLFTDLSNPTSNSIYKKIGYKLAGENISYNLK